MFYRIIFVCFVGFVLAKSAEQYSLEITFKITSTTVKKGNKIICDHNFTNAQENTYTLLEGENFTIFTKHITFINFFYCSNNNINSDGYDNKRNGFSNVATFKVEKRMGTLWKCTVLAHRDIPGMIPEVQYIGHTYSAAYCFMKIHVRQKNSPQTILVNNMVLQAVRTDLSEKDVDFTTEYQYVDGDVVKVTCANFLNPAPLMMEYAMAGTMSENSIMKELISNKAIGFRVKLHSGHNNSHMICTNTEPTDYTKVMVRFVIQTEFKTISVKINGMTLRPKLGNNLINYYDIEYKYQRYQDINVVCEVQRTDMILLVLDRYDFDGDVSSYKKTDLIPKKKAEMSFSPKPKYDKKLRCASDDIHGASVEQVVIHFTDSNFILDLYPLHMELPSNGTVMELYNDEKLKVMYYEFEDGETLQLKCGPILRSMLSRELVLPVLYLKMKDSDDRCERYGCAIYKTLHVTHKDDNTQLVCYLKKEFGFREKDGVLDEIRVILRERVLTTTTSTTTTSPVTDLTTVITTTSTTAAPASNKTSNSTFVYYMAALGVAVFIILLIMLNLSVKKRGCCIRTSSEELPPVPTPKPTPASAYYENLLAVFKPINEREAAEIEHQYEEIQ